MAFQWVQPGYMGSALDIKRNRIRVNTHKRGLDKAGSTAIAMTRTKATIVVMARIIARVVVSC